MKSKSLTILFIAIMLLSLSTVVSAETKVPQKTCPVMGNKIDKDLYVDQDGKRIYVCCKPCIDEVKKNFSKYEEKLAENGESVEVVSQASRKAECSDCTKSEKGCCKEVKSEKNSCCSDHHGHSKAEKTSCSSGKCKD